MQTLRWVQNGTIHLCMSESLPTLLILMRAIAAFYSGDEIKVQVWQGDKVIQETVS